MNLNGKRVDLDQLRAEMIAAGVTRLGFELSGDTLLTYDEAGTPAELSAAAQAVVAAHVAPPDPTPPTYGADLLSERDMRAQLAAAVDAIRTYRQLAAPTEAQRKSYENLLGRIALYELRSRFRDL